ncbi:hypothetical protein [Aquabacterium humicola]|uniref:hypothetical protein n=1 Tax=Aquabacterium humicola TaxID=3237377 RepID=UPI00254306D4|nr:hypothetical protein [Rubrivivax pictus]
MTRVDNPSLALAALQAELTLRLQRARRTQSAKAPRPAARHSSNVPRGERDAMQRVQVQLGQLAAGDPDAPRKAFRLFLESVFIEQFGEAVVLDPAFFAMVDEVQRQMEGHAELRRRMEALARSILKPGPAP